MTWVPWEVREKIPQLNEQAAQLYQQHRYKEALPLATEAVELARRYLKEDHPHFVGTINNLAMIEKDLGHYAIAESLMKEGVEIRRRILGENNIDFARSLNNLAVLYEGMGDYAKAEPLFMRALEIRRKKLGEEHELVARSLNNLAGLYDHAGNYVEAERFYLQAVEIWRKTQGEEHSDVAIGLSNLASLYQTIGNYAAAVSMYQKALEIRRKSLGEDHPETANILNKLGTSYFVMGDFETAGNFYLQAIEIQHKTLGEDHIDYATTISNLASLYRMLNDHKKSEQLYLQSLETEIKTYGEESLSICSNLNNLAGLYRMTNNYDKAEALYLRVLKIQSKVLGDNHPDIAKTLNNLTVLYDDMGKFDKSEGLYLKALELLREIREDHPDIARTLNNLAKLYVATKREDKALPLMRQAMEIDNRMIGQAFSIGSESQRSAFLASAQENFDTFLSLVLQYFPDSPEAIASAFELVLRRKGIGLEVLAAQRDAVLGGQYPRLQPKLRELSTLRMQIAQKTLSGPGPEGQEAYEQLLAGWNAQREELETNLAREIPEMDLEKKLRGIDRWIVAKAIPEHSSLIEFVRFYGFDFLAIPARGEDRLKPAHYVAFVINAAELKNVWMVDLGETEPIDRMIAELRSFITGESETRGSRDLGALPTKARGKSNDTGAKLRKAVFDPIVTMLGGRNQLLLAPDGDLTRLPFEILPTDEGNYLIDNYHISYLNTARDVLRFAVKPTIQSTEAMVIADPDFDLGSTPGVTSTEAVESSGRKSRDLNRANLQFKRLPATRVEGTRIAEILNVKPLLDKSAVETRLKTCQSPCILHLATHGFFLEDQKRELNKESRGLGAGQQQEEGNTVQLSESRLENPLLRSGLALAGVNTWLKKDKLTAEAEDGILTAEDVSGLDLLATEMAVLSACETGLGKIRVGQGVLGLRSAFTMAGAKTLVMSLWKVPDKQTQELMEDFYHRILAGQPRADALRIAQLGVKAKYPDPLYWGAFICQGNPGILMYKGK